jgi:hypothetical protein
MPVTLTNTAIQFNDGTSQTSAAVNKAGDTMTGRLTAPSATISSTAPTIDFTDTDQGTTRYLHVNGNLMGFLNTSGAWDMYADNSGQIWTANYGWIHDAFFNNVANCSNTVRSTAGAGNKVASQEIQLYDAGGQLQIGLHRVLTNCDCVCACGW